MKQEQQYSSTSYVRNQSSGSAGRPGLVPPLPRLLLQPRSYLLSQWEHTELGPVLKWLHRAEESRGAETLLTVPLPN